MRLSLRRQASARVCPALRRPASSLKPSGHEQSLKPSSRPPATTTDTSSQEKRPTKCADTQWGAEAQGQPARSNGQQGRQETTQQGEPPLIPQVTSQFTASVEEVWSEGGVGAEGAVGAGPHAPGALEKERGEEGGEYEVADEESEGQGGGGQECEQQESEDEERERREREDLEYEDKEVEEQEGADQESEEFGSEEEGSEEEEQADEGREREVGADGKQDEEEGAKQGGESEDLEEREEYYDCKSDATPSPCLSPLLPSLPPLPTHPTPPITPSTTAEQRSFPHSLLHSFPHSFPLLTEVPPLTETMPRGPGTTQSGTDAPQRACLTASPPTVTLPPATVTLLPATVTALPTAVTAGVGGEERTGQLPASSYSPPSTGLGRAPGIPRSSEVSPHWACLVAQTASTEGSPGSCSLYSDTSARGVTVRGRGGGAAVGTPSVASEASPLSLARDCPSEFTPYPSPPFRGTPAPYSDTHTPCSDRQGHRSGSGPLRGDSQTSPTFSSGSKRLLGRSEEMGKRGGVGERAKLTANAGLFGRAVLRGLLWRKGKRGGKGGSSAVQLLDQVEEEEREKERVPMGLTLSSSAQFSKPKGRHYIIGRTEIKVSVSLSIPHPRRLWAQVFPRNPEPTVTAGTVALTAGTRGELTSACPPALLLEAPDEMSAGVAAEAAAGAGVAAAGEGVAAAVGGAPAEAEAPVAAGDQATPAAGVTSVAVTTEEETAGLRPPSSAPSSAPSAAPSSAPSSAPSAAPSSALGKASALDARTLALWHKAVSGGNHRETQEQEEEESSGLESASCMDREDPAFSMQGTSMSMQGTAFGMGMQDTAYTMGQSFRVHESFLETLPEESEEELAELSEQLGNAPEAQGPGLEPTGAQDSELESEEELAELSEQLGPAPESQGPGLEPTGAQDTELESEEELAELSEQLGPAPEAQDSDSNSIGAQDSELESVGASVQRGGVWGRVTGEDGEEVMSALSALGAAVGAEDPTWVWHSSERGSEGSEGLIVAGGEGEEESEEGLKLGGSREEEGSVEEGRSAEEYWNVVGSAERSAEEERRAEEERSVEELIGFWSQWPFTRRASSTQGTSDTVTHGALPKSYSDRGPRKSVAVSLGEPEAEEGGSGRGEGRGLKGPFLSLKRGTRVVVPLHLDTHDDVDTGSADSAPPGSPMGSFQGVEGQSGDAPLAHHASGRGGDMLEGSIGPLQQQYGSYGFEAEEGGTVLGMTSDLDDTVMGVGDTVRGAGEDTVAVDLAMLRTVTEQPVKAIAGSEGLGWPLGMVRELSDIPETEPVTFGA